MAANFGRYDQGLAVWLQTYTSVSIAMNLVDFADANVMDFAPGITIGQRTKSGAATARIGVGYHRWLRDELNEIRITLMLGGIISSPD
jgi:hypothetical protein